MATSELPEQLLKAGLEYSSRMGSISLRLALALLPLPDIGRVVELGSARLARSTLVAAKPAGPPRRAPDAQGLLTIEADAGTVGYGVFIVENRGAQPVTTALEVSSFSPETGRAVRPEVTFEPPSLTLAPGEQALVQVGVRVRRAWDAGTAYRATISLPGLEGAAIPIAVTRRSPEA